MWPLIVIVGLFAAAGALILYENVKKVWRGDDREVMMTPPPANHDWSKSK
jgi:hypothetical protein